MKNILIIGAFFLYIKGFSQELVIDLSKNEGTEQTRSISPNNDFKIKIINKLPGKSYSISMIKENIPIDEIDLSGKADSITTDGGGVARCMEFISSVMEIYEIEDEAKIPAKKKEINSEINKFQRIFQSGTVRDPDTGCEQIQIYKAEEIIQSTEEVLDKIPLKMGEKVTVVVTRDDDGETKKWISVFTTGSRGEFQISYGFSFITQMMSQENIFFTNSIDNEFFIQKEVNRRSMTFVPSLFFTWMGKRSFNNNFAFSLSGGLGFDFENPTVFLGPTISFNENIKIHLGIAGNKQYSLLGRYTDGQQISELLTIDQLHEKIYKLNPYFSLSLRLKNNPFEASED
ncbi:hypothetical protein [Cyclobacterium plantarum]|uniref:hypothetical protein n=1 Tax=Cyclobacterium plantarum TaxID=2716263 RepID=UPI003F6F0EA6